MAGRPAFRAWSCAADASLQTLVAIVIEIDLRGTMAKTGVHKAGVFFDCAECGKLLRDCAEHNTPIPPDCLNCGAGLVVVGSATRALLYDALRATVVSMANSKIPRKLAIRH
jgi:hypothetical protein